MTDKTLDDAKHHPPESGQSVAQSDRHPDHFVEPDVRYKSSLFDIDRFDRHLVISHRQVKSAKHVAPANASSASSSLGTGNKSNFVTEFRR